MASQALDLIYLLTTIILSGLCLLFKKGTWLALGILIGLSLVWPIYSYFFPCVFRSAQIGEKQEKILPAHSLYTLIFLGSFLADTDYTDAFGLLCFLLAETIVLNFICYKKNSTLDSRCQLGKMRADCVSKTTTLKALKKQKSPTDR